MAKFQVSYETTSKPRIDTLPVGARITQTSVLPASIAGETSVYGDTTKVRVEKSSMPGQAYVRVTCGYETVTTRLNKAAAKDLIEALQEIVNA